MADSQSSTEPELDRVPDTPERVPKKPKTKPSSKPKKSKTAPKDPEGIFTTQGCLASVGTGRFPVKSKTARE